MDDVSIKKISKRATSGMIPKNLQSNTIKILDNNPMTIGTEVFLKSWKKANKNVALGTIMSCDPKEEFHRVQLGNEFWMVHVDVAMEKHEELIRPFKSYKLMCHAEGANIAWPATFVDKING